MFDLSWGEIALIGAVALIVIGPKELPGVLRGIGQTMAKLRAMASDFQYQFNQALREAEVDKVKDTISDINKGIDAAKPAFDPVGYARDQIRSAVDDVQKTVSGQGVAAGAAAGAAVTSSDFVGPPAAPAPDIVAQAIPAPETYAVDPGQIQASMAPPPVVTAAADGPLPITPEVSDEPQPEPKRTRSKKSQTT